jgi:Domain of unknown function (DUF4276)
MKRVLSLVEGQTEEVFVRDVLTPHLAPFGVLPTQVLLKTKRTASGSFKGGVTSSEQVIGDVRRLLGDTGAAAITTMIDYYGLPSNFPGMTARPTHDAYARVAHVEAAFADVFNEPRFVPHLVLHEYEAWIFSAPEACDWVFEDPSLWKQLEGIAATAGGAERINDTPTNAPSKRLARLFPAYKKTFHGPMAVDAIGIPALRQACPHANAWLRRIETI